MAAVAKRLASGNPRLGPAHFGRRAAAPGWSGGGAVARRRLYDDLGGLAKIHPHRRDPRLSYLGPAFGGVSLLPVVDRAPVRCATSLGRVGCRGVPVALRA